MGELPAVATKDEGRGTGDKVRPQRWNVARTLRMVCSHRREQPAGGGVARRWHLQRRPARRRAVTTSCRGADGLGPGLSLFPAPSGSASRNPGLYCTPTPRLASPMDDHPLDSLRSRDCAGLPLVAPRDSVGRPKGLPLVAGTCSGRTDLRALWKWTKKGWQVRGGSPPANPAQAGVRTGCAAGDAALLFQALLHRANRAGLVVDTNAGHVRGLGLKFLLSDLGQAGQDRAVHGRGVILFFAARTWMVATLG